ncbi:MAG: enoyl-ACP reductase [Alphaproteobacteria bacterium]|jgi:enoyl-[acyl-carrier protein] reductase I|nr:enoyl-ACP reductase [Alphaproteobacteria bacterium]
MSKLMEGKKGLIMGVLNDHSIAWSIAEKLKEQGAEIAFTYANEPAKKRLTPLVESIGESMIFECDVTNPDTIKNTFTEIKNKWGKIDFLVHAIAFSDKSELNGKYLNTTLNNFLNTMHISAYSLVEVMQHAAPLMSSGGSVITLTYYGAEKVLPNYNVMGVAKAALESSVKYLAEDLGSEGIRVNAISAGPIKTLAASGIGDFNAILNWNAENSPLRRTVSQSEVAGTALYLLSDLSSGVTGEIHHVDAGYNIIGMKATH